MYVAAPFLFCSCELCTAATRSVHLAPLRAPSISGQSDVQRHVRGRGGDCAGRAKVDLPRLLTCAKYVLEMAYKSRVEGDLG
jgi:hypothetical protein